MGNATSFRRSPKPHVRLIPREPLQEKFDIPAVEPGYPEPRAASTPKKDIYKEDKNRDIYFHALHAPRDIEDSWDHLVDYLTSIYRTDMMKVRSIFSWLGVQEIEGESYLLVPTPNSVEEMTPRGYKKIIKDRKGSYATLFALLCRKAGIRCAIINGVSKGNGYAVGDDDVSSLRDRWNAVYIDGWRLIHPLWAFKNVISYKTGKWVPRKEQSKEKIKIEDVTDEEYSQKIDHDFNEYYFMVDPNELINVCFPDDDRWQMTSSRMTKARWLAMPLLMKRYHMDGFKIAGEFKTTLHSKNGVVGLAVNEPRKNESQYQLSYDFFFNYATSDERPEVDEAIHLRRFVLMARDAKNKKWCFEARIAIPGMYRITVYGGDCARKKLPWICDIAVQCKKPMKEPKPYPDCPKIGFGPVAMTERYGLTNPSHPNGMLFVKPRTSYHLTFKLSRSIEVKAFMFGEGFKPEDLDKWVHVTINNQSKLHVLDIAVTIQVEGEYSLGIMAREKDARVKDPWENILNYYLSTDTPRQNGMAVKDKGYKTAKEINTRKALEEASRGTDMFELQAALNKFKDEGLHEEEQQSFGKASLKMEYLELAKALKEATNRRHYELLEKSIDKAEASCHAQQLRPLIEKAREVRDSLPHPNKFIHDVLEMKQSTIAEMTSYSTPVPLIHNTLMASLLLLGENKKDVEAWDDVRKLFKRTGREGVIFKIRKFDYDNVEDDVINDVDTILAAYEEDTVIKASAGAGTFFKWAKSVIETRRLRDASTSKE